METYDRGSAGTAIDIVLVSWAMAEYRVIDRLGGQLAAFLDFRLGDSSSH